MWELIGATIVTDIRSPEVEMAFYMVGTGRPSWVLSRTSALELYGYCHYCTQRMQVITDALHFTNLLTKVALRCCSAATCD